MIKSLLPLAVPAAQPELLTETVAQEIKSIHGETAIDASASTVSADAVAIVTGAVATSRLLVQLLLTKKAKFRFL